MQVTVISGLFAVLFYLIAATLQASKDSGSGNMRNQVFSLGAVAVAAHAVSAFGVLRIDDGYRFGIVEISSLITVLIAASVLFSCMRRPLANLAIPLFPLAAFAIVISLMARSDYPPINMSPGLASHVLISIMAYSIFSVAALQAAFVAYQNYQLKHAHAGGILRHLPPLQDMEAFLFELLWIGQLLLSLGIVAGLVFFDDIWDNEGIIHKAFFSLLAWVVFAILLWGRHQRGWRGRTAVRGTLAGFVLLIIGFYGSKLVLEIILR